MDVGLRNQNGQGYGLSESPPGSYDVCEICHWIDDPLQFGDAEFVSDTNHISLEEARRRFRETGAVSESSLSEARTPSSADTRDSNWPYNRSLSEGALEIVVGG